MLPSGFKRHFHRPKGFTLLEMMVCLSVLTMIIMVTIAVVSTTSDHMKFELVVSNQQTRTRATLDAMMHELRTMSISREANFEVPNATENGVTFEVPRYNSVTQAIEYDYPETTHNDLVTYRRALSDRSQGTGGEIQGNGLDDDGNGLIDAEDGIIERLVGDPSNPAEYNIICVNVPSDGFLIIKNGRRLQIRVARQDVTPLKTNDERRITTVVTYNTYCLRNP